MVAKNILESKLAETFKPEFMEVFDLSDGCGSKYQVIMVSEKFQGKTLLQRHRLVNNALAEELKQIHAFSQKTYTPEEWKELPPEKKQQQ